MPTAHSTVERIAAVVERNLTGPRRFSTGSIGFQAFGKVFDDTGRRYQTNALAVLIGSKAQNELRPSVKAEDLSSEMGRIARLARPKLFKSGRDGFYAAGKVKLSEVERYQVTVQALSIAAAPRADVRTTRPARGPGVAGSLTNLELLSDGVNCRFEASELDMGAFFAVRSRGAAIIITLGRTHPAFPLLSHAVRDQGAEGDAVRLLLEAWARYEDEQPEGRRLQWAQEAREDWGRTARRLVTRQRREE